MCYAGTQLSLTPLFINYLGKEMREEVTGKAKQFETEEQKQKSLADRKIGKVRVKREFQLS